MKSNKPEFRPTRRGVLTGAAAGVLAAGVPAVSEAVPMRMKDPAWNRDAFARLQGNLDFGKVKHGWYAGTVCGVRDGEAVRPIMGFEGFSSTRLVDNGDGSYQKLLREVVYYKDLETGEILETFVNPYTGEEVKVVHVANDPFNIVIEKYYPKGPSYGGLRDDSVEERRPMILPWKITSSDTVTLATDIHLYYPSALQPDEWPRESSGKFVRVSEMFRYIIPRKDLESSKTSVVYSGAWSRINPWMPWMLMGQAPGHTFYMGTMGGYDNLDMLSDTARRYAEKHNPEYFDAPTKWEEPSLSSLEDYARTQKPAPVK